MYSEKIKDLIIESIKVKENLPIQDIQKLIETIIRCYKKGGKILVCGNGGSAADAQHMSGEFLNRFKIERNPWPCIALTTDTSTITAIGNDYSFDEIFSKQVEAHGKEGDILIGISTSGNSKNVIKAVEFAKKKKMVSIGFLGNNGGHLGKLCDLSIIVDSRDTPRIQESHTLIMHIMCEIVEKELVALNL
ncbi:MAG: D-sedoheptulose 7-phosphate isomerase [Nanoarchaeota archaeon]